MKSMMRWILSMMCTAMLTSTITFADAINITGSSGAAWQNWSTANLGTSGTPYWNNGSSDGNPPGNIGYILTSSGLSWGGQSMPAGPGAIPYWGMTNGSADPSFTFSSSGQDATAVQISIAGNRASNILGYEDETGMHQLLSGGVSGNTATFTPTGAFSFYLQTPSDGTFYTDSSLNTNNTAGEQHFAVFQAINGTFWIGAEDLALNHSDKDYQDLIFTLTGSPDPSPLPAPEPSSLILLGTGLGAIGLAAWRRRK